MISRHNPPMQKVTEPLTLVLVGATGDLAKKKILKASYMLYEKGLLPDDFLLLGNARSTHTKESFQLFVKGVVLPRDESIWEGFSSHLDYVSGDVTDEQTFIDIKKHLDDSRRLGNLLWYIASFPSLYDDIIRHVGNCQLNSRPGGWVKFMLEKPFGTDYESAKMLNAHLLKIFTENQIYRIDHFLAKETVQTLLAFRFANSMFEHVWNRESIDHIQVNAVEDLGITGREKFYDATGTIRDVVQNHVLQMIAMTMMEQPKSLSEKDIREVRKDLLASISPLPQSEMASCAKFGQYIGYRQEVGIASTSRTETAVAFTLHVHNDRWNGVPVYVRAGKHLTRSVTEITVIFKPNKLSLFGSSVKTSKQTALTLRIGPNEGVIIHLAVKRPGIDFVLDEVPMQFCYKNEFQMDLVEAYVKLLYDAIVGDPTLFPHADGIESSWACVEPLLQHLQSNEYEPEPYEKGSWGPTSFEELLKKDGRVWMEPSAAVCSISNYSASKK